MFLLKVKTILLGNDVLIPLGGNINMESRKLELKKIYQEIPMVKPPGGHFVIPVRTVAQRNLQGDDGIKEPTNIKGDEAEAVMLILLANTNDELDLKNCMKK